MSGSPVDVWYQLTDRLDEREHAEAIELLSTTERERWRRFVHEKHRRDFAAAHALLRRALSARAARPPTSWQFRTDPSGKPHVHDSDFALQFNIAHTDGLVACALTQAGDIGVDAEAIDRVADPLDIAARYFSEREVRELHECDALERRTRFIELWTLKEAWLKALGTGLRSPLGDFRFEWSNESRLRFVPPPGIAADEWHFVLLAPSERHRMALAIRCPTPVRLHTRDWSRPDGPPLTILRTSSPA